MIHIDFFSIFRRIAIIAFWASIITAFLLVPKAVNMFRQERTLTIFTWPLMLDPIYLKKFEKETGIKLYITYYDSSSALLSKLKASKGAGYDLIIADDHTAELIIQNKLVKKIDWQKIPFKDEINPFLRSRYYDPHDEYTLAHYWGFCGIGYDADYFGTNQPPQTWGLLFDPKLMPEKICMTDDPREALMITAQYLYGSIDVLKEPAKLKHIKEVLLAQKKHVEVYSNARADNLLQTKSCPVAAIMSPEVQRLQKEHHNVQFLSPQEGGFLVIDLFMLSQASTKDDLAYQFLNYLYRPEVVEHHSKLFGYCSPLLRDTLSNNFCSVSNPNYDFFRNVIPDREINNIWIEILAA
jgi:spermidine/putrescine transport system substrate-binding protein